MGKKFKEEMKQKKLLMKKMFNELYKKNVTTIKKGKMGFFLSLIKKIVNRERGIFFFFLKKEERRMRR